jgi:hypothetical protein
MNSLKTAITLIALSLCSFSQARQLTVQVQIKNYEGESSYSALYLVNPSGRYEQTLWVSGTEEKYYEEGLGRWWKYLSRKPQPIDGVTGASTAAGDRYLVKVEVPDTVFSEGYSLRVETSVEDQENHSVDIEVPISPDTENQKLPGQGWVSFLRYR